MRPVTIRPAPHPRRLPPTETPADALQGIHQALAGGLDRDQVRFLASTAPVIDDRMVHVFASDALATYQALRHPAMPAALRPVLAEAFVQATVVDAYWQPLVPARVGHPPTDDDWGRMQVLLWHTALTEDPTLLTPAIAATLRSRLVETAVTEVSPLMAAALLLAWPEATAADLHRVIGVLDLDALPAWTADVATHPSATPDVWAAYLRRWGVCADWSEGRFVVPRPFAALLEACTTHKDGRCAVALLDELPPERIPETALTAGDLFPLLGHPRDGLREAAFNLVHLVPQDG